MIGVESTRLPSPMNTIFCLEWLSQMTGGSRVLVRLPSRPVHRSQRFACLRPSKQEPPPRNCRHHDKSPQEQAEKNCLGPPQISEHETEVRWCDIRSQELTPTTKNVRLDDRRPVRRVDRLDELTQKKWAIAFRSDGIDVRNEKERCEAVEIVRKAVDDSQNPSEPRDFF
jgi:hypothetical protein